jgi:uncharacterized protein YndB with AHSA1/START domain
MNAESAATPEPATIGPIRRAVIVRPGVESAFEFFTQRMGAWWPLDGYSRAVREFATEGVRATRLEFQARLGGAILEHMSDGRIVPWGEVVVWDPPHRVVMAWHPHDLPEPPTELDVTFTSEAGGTRLALEHRGWERLSAGFRDELYPIYDQGWITTLERFAAAAGGREPA